MDHEMLDWIENQERADQLAGRIGARYSRESCEGSEDLEGCRCDPNRPDDWYYLNSEAYLTCSSEVMAGQRFCYGIAFS